MCDKLGYHTLNGLLARAESIHGGAPIVCEFNLGGRVGSAQNLALRLVAAGAACRRGAYGSEPGVSVRAELVSRLGQELGTPRRFWEEKCRCWVRGDGGVGPDPAVRMMRY